jgi:hypothetical protein
MHDHDFDLIMALADGMLDASSVQAAEASIAACDECSRDLELQRQALALLGAAPRVGMTEMESARMRRTLRDDLGLAAASQAAAVATVKKRRFGWTGALSAAAVLLIVVLAAPTLDLLGTNDSDNATADDAFAALATTTTVASAAPESAAGGSAAEDGNVAEAEDTLRSTELSADESTTTFEAASAVGEIRDDLTLLDIESAYAASFFAPDARSLYSGAVAPPETDQFDRCAEVGIAELESEDIVVNQWGFVGLREAQGLQEAILVYETASGDVVVMVHDAETCEIIDRT